MNKEELELRAKYKGTMPTDFWNANFNTITGFRTDDERILEGLDNY